MGLIATLREGVRIAFDSLFANKVRSFLTVLGVAIGVLVVVVMAAAIEGINVSFKDALGSEPDTFWAMHAPFDANFGDDSDDGERSPFWANEPLNPAWTSLLQRLPEVEYVEPVADLGQRGYVASVAGEEVRLSLVAVGPRYLEIAGGDVTSGRYFSDVENGRRTPVVLVDSAVAEDLWHGRNPLDRTVSIGLPNRRQAVFRTIGIYRPIDNLFSGLATHYALVPFSSADKHLGVWDRMIAYIIVPAEGVSLEVAQDAVRGRMRQLRGLGPGDEDDFALITQQEVLDFWNKLTGVLFMVAIALSGVGLMVGGVGVVGIMMISVTERTREIGVRKALGARRRDLLLQFLVEAATLTALGGAIGLAMGGGLAWIVQSLTPLPAQIPIWAIIVALVASVATGVGFGLYPAARGAKLDPVDALRYE
jgi:putative ABC transport system permease protein